MLSRSAVILADTNVIIEAVRTKCWNAVTGGLRIETVETCRDEARGGDRHRPGYVAVSGSDLARLATVHPVTALDRATFGMHYAHASGMDAGERDLFAHAHRRVLDGDEAWLLCSPDKASIRAAVALGWANGPNRSRRSWRQSADAAIRHSPITSVSAGCRISGPPACWFDDGAQDDDAGGRRKSRCPPALLSTLPES